MSSIRWWLFLPLVVAPCALSISPAACKQAFGGETPAPPPGEAWLTPAQVQSMRIATEAVGEHDVEGTLPTTGRIAFDDTRLAHVYSPVTGRVLRIDAELGAHLAKGAPLALIDSPDLGSASAEYRKAVADRTAARHNFEREKTLWANRATSQLEYEQAEDAWHRAKAEFDRCAQKLALFGVAPSSEVTQRYVLRAPIEGELLARLVAPNVEVEGLYGGGTATELFTVGDAERLWVLADVYELDVARVHVGARAEVVVAAYPGESFGAEVDWVSPTLDPSTRTAKVRCVLPNADARLKPEMYASVRIAVNPRRALAIPKAALLRMGDQAVVFVRKPGSTSDGRVAFERRPVIVDEAMGEREAPVLHGLEPGEVVVTAGAELLSGAI